jgi:hypothetical protein
MWNLSIFGDTDIGIRPYRLLNKRRSVEPEQQMRHLCVKNVMKYLQQVVDEESSSIAGAKRIPDLPLSKADDVFDAAFASMLTQLYVSAPKRAQKLTVSTIYNRQQVTCLECIRILSA